MKIGIFDSGIGGLTLARAYLAHPTTEVLYIADTAHMPYGNKSHEDVQKFTTQCIDFLYSQAVDALIVACHTATTRAGNVLKQKYTNISLITMEETIIPQTVAATKNGHIALLATKGTVQSNVYQNLLQRYNKNLNITAQACPTLACTIEQYYNKQDMLKTELQRYLDAIDTSCIDTYILGCTHYSFIKEILREQFPLSTIISSDETITDALIIPPCSTQDVTLKKHQFFVTGNRDAFATQVQTLLEYWNMSTVPYTLEKIDVIPRKSAARYNN